MLLVGCRTAANHEPIFLLQNWWQEMQFVEVDAAYLKACGGIFTFSSVAPSSFPEGMDVVDLKRVVDAPDACEQPFDA